jgi:hypothetical protein
MSERRRMDKYRLRSRHPRLEAWLAVFAMLSAASGLSACDRALPPARFIDAYEAEALTKKTAGDYTFATLLMTPEYLLARQMDGAWDKPRMERFREAYRGIHYISVRVSQTSATGGPEDLRTDLLGGELLKGEEAYRRRLDLLENRLGPYIRLVCADGRSVEPRSYRFQRGSGLDGVHAFLFLFPAWEGGREVRMEGARIVIKDFGLNTGTLRIPIGLSEHLSLKV